MKTNERLQKDIQDAIKWEPLLNAAEIGVTVNDGIVTLTGSVDSYPKKSEAEIAAKNVAGVKAVVENIEVKFPNQYAAKADADIANDVVTALEWNWQIPGNLIKVQVEKGWVTLEGELEWNYQREAVSTAVKNVQGIKGVSNDITIMTTSQDGVEKRDVENALRRDWSIDDKHIKVKVENHQVTLTGTVSSWYQKEEAERMAWKAPGVWKMENALVVEY